MKSKCMLIFCFLFLLFSFKMTVNAQLPEIQESILQVMVMYVDEEGEEHAVQGGSGFLIGDEESGSSYIITAKEVTTVTVEKAEELIELYELDKQATDLRYEVKVVVRRDIMVNAQIVAESEEMGFSICKLEQSLYDRTPVVLSDMDMTELIGKTATVMGYSTAPILGEEIIYYTVDDITTQSGNFIGDEKIKEVAYLYHTAVIESGMIGGPVVNEEGAVVAISQNITGQNGYYGLQIVEVIPVLDALGIPYITQSQKEEQIQTELAAIIHKEELINKMEEIEKISGEDYRADSYQALLSSLEFAREVEQDAQATQEEVDAAVDMLEEAQGNLEAKTPIWLIVLYIFIPIIVLIIIVFIVLYKTKTLRKERNQKRVEEMTVTQAAPVFEKKTIEKQDYKQLIQQDLQSVTRKREFIGAVEKETYGETTVFQSTETSSIELQKNKYEVRAYLFRRRTKEKISITQDEFVLGKDVSQTDYCISGNSAISRTHAVILFRNGIYEVADKNATNGTFVNDNKIDAFQKCEIKHDDILRLADEEFEFKINA